MGDIHPVDIGGTPPAFVPMADVLEFGGAIVIRLALPGVLEEDIDISFDVDGLTVRGELEPPVVVDEGRAVLREWRYGFFERHFVLPEDFDREGLSILVEFGVLELRIPRRG